MTKPTSLADFRYDPDSDDDFIDTKFVAVEIARLLAEGDTNSVGEFLANQEIADVAAWLEELDTQPAMQAMRLLPLHDQAEVIGYLRPSSQLIVAAQMGRRELARVMAAMSHDERADLYKQLDTEAQEALSHARGASDRDLVIVEEAGD